MLDTTAHHVAEPAFVVAASSTHTPFSIDNDAFAGWLATGGDQLQRNLPAPSNEAPGQTLSELAYRALRAAVLVGDPGIELNVHGCVAIGTGYVVRLNNLAGSQQLVGITRGSHEPRWPANNPPAGEKARCYLQQICEVANALLNDLLTTIPAFDATRGQGRPLIATSPVDAGEIASTSQERPSYGV
ncbi:hypothetical protein [Mycobacterium sp. 050134]|uniref:hypothetical protein n=1 Tax=Mycobacterium sp. 050134 TaxID=3096111 RepID=UPI002ED8263C